MAYNIIKKTNTNQNGKPYTIAYIDPKTSDPLYGKNDILKKYNAKPDTRMKPWVWFWFIGETEEEQNKVIQKYIKPCLVELNKQLTGGDENEIIATIDELISKLSTAKIELSGDDANINPQYDSASDIKKRLEEFKRDLVNAMSDEDFKAKLEPIIKFRNAQGHRYSLLNTILIWIQDQKATMVKSRSNWLKINRDVVKNARAISMWTPYTVPVGKDQKEEITKRYLQDLRKTDIKQLTITEREELDILLKQVKPNAMGKVFSLAPAFYDVSQTVQIEGKEELVGNNKPDIEWYEEGREDERVEIVYSSLIEFANEKGISIEMTSDLGGSRGVSKSGSIEILSNSGKDVGMTQTLAHEISHELLHQTYLSTRDETLKQYFVGTKEGRGKVEQQAEVSAWIVMKNFGFDSKTSINYVGIWGADEKNVVKVFDDVAKVASVLIEYVESKMKSAKNEDFNPENDKITGLDVAKLLGVDDIYLKQSKFNVVRESFYNIYKKLLK